MKRSVKIALWVLGPLLGIPLVVGLLGYVVMRIEQPQMYADEVYELEPPTLPEHIRENAVLVFSKTSHGFRHGGAIDAANTMIERLAKKHGWQVYFTENAGVFNTEQLERFAVVVWNNSTGAALTADQRLRFRTWLEGGHGYVGLHAAGDGSHANWDWYTNKLLGVSYNTHTLLPEHMPMATVIVEDKDHLASAHLPDSFDIREEWYAWHESPRSYGTTILATVDESTYTPWRAAMGKDHPIVWTRGVGLGRVFYSGFGHEATAYEDPLLVPMMENAIIWAGQLDRPRR
jgi:type 1 glutamine amidotransferase